MKIVGKKLSKTICDRREGDASILIASADKAKEELGWIPKITNLELSKRNIVATYNNFFKNLWKKNSLEILKAVNTIIKI